MARALVALRARGSPWRSPRSTSSSCRRAAGEGRGATCGTCRLDVILVAATHTHSGPGGFWNDVLGARFGTGPYDPALEDALARPDRRRDPRRRRARASRRASPSAGARRRGPRPRTATAARVAGSLLVVRVERTGGRAGSGRWSSSRPTPPSAASRNRLLSGDWPGALARELPGVTVFLQGAEGDQTWALPGSAARPAARSPTGGSSPSEVRRSPTLRVTPVPPLAAADGRGLAARAVVRRGPALPRPAPLEPALELDARADPRRRAADRRRPRSSPFPPSRARRWEAPGASALGPGAEVVSLVGDYVGYVETAGGSPRAHRRGEADLPRSGARRACCRRGSPPRRARSPRPADGRTG